MNARQRRVARRAFARRIRTLAEGTTYDTMGRVVSCWTIDILDLPKEAP